MLDVVQLRLYCRCSSCTVQLRRRRCSSCVSNYAAVVAPPAQVQLRGRRNYVPRNGLRSTGAQCCRPTEKSIFQMFSCTSFRIQPRPSGFDAINLRELYEDEGPYGSTNSQKSSQSRMSVPELSRMSTTLDVSLRFPFYTNNM